MARQNSPNKCDDAIEFSCSTGRGLDLRFSVKKVRRIVAAFGLVVVSVACLDAQERWTEAQANAWYAAQPWPVGANFLPSTAINELEMWQADTFDAATIDRELGWAEGIGMNTMR